MTGAGSRRSADGVRALEIAIVVLAIAGILALLLVPLSTPSRLKAWFTGPCEELHATAHMSQNPKDFSSFLEHVYGPGASQATLEATQITLISCEASAPGGAIVLVELTSEEAAQRLARQPGSEPLCVAGRFVFSDSQQDADHWRDKTWELRRFCGWLDGKVIGAERH